MARRATLFEDKTYQEVQNRDGESAAKYVQLVQYETAWEMSTEAVKSQEQQALRSRIYRGKEDTTPPC